MKTEKEIVAETIEFYGADPEGRRADDGHACLYFAKIDGRVRRCSVGRCFTVENAKLAEKAYRGGVSEDLLANIPMKAPYQGHGVVFWENLQGLHDAECYWKAGGLTGMGATYVDDKWPGLLEEMGL